MSGLSDGCWPALPAWLSSVMQCGGGLSCRSLNSRLTTIRLLKVFATVAAADVTRRTYVESSRHIRFPFPFPLFTAVLSLCMF